MLNQTFMDKEHGDCNQVNEESIDMSLNVNNNSYLRAESGVLDTSLENIGAQQKIRLIPDFIGSGHFPFGAEIDSSTTELDLN